MSEEVLRVHLRAVVSAMAAHMEGNDELALELLESVLEWLTLDDMEDDLTLPDEPPESELPPT